jgi:DNA-directed RNA polymerase specialized sigma24 family protein
MADDGGFDEFVGAQYADLLRVAYLLTGSRADAEDLVQAALVRVLRRWSRVDDPMAYVRRAMVNQHINVWRRVRRREVLTAQLPDAVFGDPAETVSQRTALLAALRTLPGSPQRLPNSPKRSDCGSSASAIPIMQRRQQVRETPDG